MSLPSLLQDYADKQLQLLIEQRPVIAQWNKQTKQQLTTVIGLSNVITSYSIHYTKLYEKRFNKRLAKIIVVL